MDLVLRTMVDSDLDFAVAQTEREGWTTCRERLALLLAHEPEGGYVAEVQGARVGMARATAFASSGWIGNVIVEPAFRGRGIGRKLVEACLDRFAALGRATVRLDGDPPGVPLYRSLGFVDEYESCRMVGHGPWRASASCAVDLAEGDWPGLLALDRQVFGDDRGRLLGLLREEARAVVVAGCNGAISGYAMLTPSRTGLQLGPCCASGADVARCVVEGCLARAGASEVAVGFPAPNAEARALLKRLRFLPASPSLRMVRGPVTAAGRPDMVYAIASGATG
jgi:predicted N-acetyltransferase YhbS